MILNVCFNDFTGSVDSHKKNLLNEIVMFDMPTAILDNTFKKPFIDTTVNETLQ